MREFSEKYRNKKRSEVEKRNHRGQFLHVMDFVRLTVEFEETVENQIAILDYHTVP